MNTANVWDGRHPSVRHFEPLFAFGHLPAGPLRDTSAMVAALAGDMLSMLGDGPELSAGLRKLLETKDCMVRQAVFDMQWLKAQEVQRAADAATGSIPVVVPDATG